MFARLAVATALAATVACHAQSYPTKPVRIVVPFPAGGPTDTLARLVGQKLTESLGQTFLVDNRAGATGTIGTGLVAKTPPDGYTLLMSATSNYVAAFLYQKLPYDPERDLAPLIRIATLPFDVDSLITIDRIRDHWQDGPLPSRKSAVRIAGPLHRRPRALTFRE